MKKEFYNEISNAIHKNTRGLVFLIVLSFISVQGHAEILFSGTSTGADLLTDPNASFPTRQPTANGTSIDFGTGTGPLWDVLLEYPLIAASASAGRDVTASMTLDLTPLPPDPASVDPADNDTGLGLTDGTNFVVILRGDNFGGDFIFLEGIWADIGGTISSFGPLVQNTGLINPFNVEFEIPGAGGLVDVNVTGVP